MSEPSSTEKALQVSLALREEHGTPDLGNKADPLNEMVYIALTRQTHEINAQRSWLELTSRYPTRESLLQAPQDEVAAVIARGGFSRQKAQWIQRSLRLIKDAFGELSLAGLRDMGDEEAENFLCSLPGINLKSARCVIMYSLGRQVLPVDTHVRRLSERLGLVPAGLTSRRIHDELERVVPPQERYDYHVNAVVHGRKVCTVARPKCGECVIRRWCCYYYQGEAMRRGEEGHAE